MDDMNREFKSLSVEQFEPVLSCCSSILLQVSLTKNRTVNMPIGLLHAH